MAEHGAMTAAVPHEHHPGEPTYVRLLIILAIITIAEVAVYYVEALADLIVPILVVLATIKFTGVVGWFMHLRFDHRLLTAIFGGCLIIALIMAIVLAVLHEYNDFWVGQTFS